MVHHHQHHRRPHRRGYRFRHPGHHHRHRRHGHRFPGHHHDHHDHNDHHHVRITYPPAALSVLFSTRETHRNVSFCASQTSWLMYIVACLFIRFSLFMKVCVHTLIHLKHCMLSMRMRIPRWRCFIRPAFASHRSDAFSLETWSKPHFCAEEHHRLLYHLWEKHLLMTGHPASRAILVRSGNPWTL